YFFNQNDDNGLIIIGETDDYFYFTIALQEGTLSDKYSLTLSQDSKIYFPLSKILSGFKVIDVFEEGTPERKSLSFEKLDSDIKLTFNLTNEPKVFYTIEFANLRRLGDARFRNLIKEGKEKLDVDTESDFRYKFKVRLHNLLNDLEDVCINNQTQQL
ncbi:MAG: hypothetical protein ACLRFE_02760, partial [Clostridia bacterium]